MGYAGANPAMQDFDHPSPLVRKAFRFATAAHAGQVKDADGSPYIEHPIAVANLLRDAGYDDEVVAAALLHDVIEHSGVSIRDVREAFGDGVGGLVAAMTEPAGIEPWERRKRAHRERIARGGDRARALFAADKATNAAALRRAIRRGGRPERLDGRIDHYTATLDMLPGRGDPVATRLRSELDRLAEERAPTADRSHLRSPS